MPEGIAWAVLVGIVIGALLVGNVRVTRPTRDKHRAETLALIADEALSLLMTIQPEGTRAELMPRLVAQLKGIGPGTGNAAVLERVAAAALARAGIR